MPMFYASHAHLPHPLRSFTSHVSTLALLDEEYMLGMPEHYSNEPRQFYVSRSRFNRSHQCSQPATIVFRVSWCTVSTFFCTVSTFSLYSQHSYIRTLHIQTL